MSLNNFYVYAYIRNKDSDTAKAGTPYYIGKGKANRAYRKHRNNSTPLDINYIKIVSENLTEQDAFELEKQLIKQYGRKDNNSGILMNRTDAEMAVLE